jgi:hypothetical protein
MIAIDCDELMETTTAGDPTPVVFVAFAGQDQPIDGGRAL